MNLTLLLFLCLITFQSHGSSELDASSKYENVDIQLVTISPGEYYWSAFGHSAIRIKSPGFDRMFGFGYFDFSDEDFFSNFVQGNMQYFLGVVDSNHELSGYKKEGRQVVLQNLTLSSEQKKQLVEKLVFLAQPENRYYHYDYFLNNCTSKIRDIIDEVTNGELSSQLKPIMTSHSWNDYTFPVTNQAWVNLGIAYIYGIPAFSKQNKWQLSVFPEVFSDDITKIDSANSWNSDYEVYYQPNEIELKRSEKHFIKTHYAVFLSVGLLLLGLLFKKTYKSTMVMWLTLQNLLGIGLLLLWLFTQHNIAAWNINLLIFSPFALLLLFKSTNKPLLLNAFLIGNIVWIILALVFTNLYLIGFCLLNLLIWKNHRSV